MGEVITHYFSLCQDGVLKLWQLSRPKLNKYSIIMVDEAQDMNAAMLDVFLRQPYAKVSSHGFSRSFVVCPFSYSPAVDLNDGVTCIPE